MFTTNPLRHTRRSKIYRVISEGWPWSSYQLKKNVYNKSLAAHQKIEDLSGEQRKLAVVFLAIEEECLQQTPCGTPDDLNLSGDQRKLAVVFLSIEEECLQQTPCGTPEDRRSIG
ncbi:hypothetical protein G9A89_001161 [Geosiphon pyriformis]|nr:hypothetical protein G9A89_001161 [Geosiphon pyriformis]